jgi:hypothetical protein
MGTDQDPELESLSDWVRTIRSLVQGRIHKLKNCVNSRPNSVFKDQEAIKCLSSLHDKYEKSPFGDSHVEWYSDHQWLHVQMGCIEKESGSSHKSEGS